jgi:hypothetical protein
VLAPSPEAPSSDLELEAPVHPVLTLVPNEPPAQPVTAAVPAARDAAARAAATSPPTGSQWDDPATVLHLGTFPLTGAARLRAEHPSLWANLRKAAAHVAALDLLRESDGALPAEAAGLVRGLAESLGRTATLLASAFSPRAGVALREIAAALTAWRPGEAPAPITPEQCEALLDSELVVLVGPLRGWSFQADAPVLSMVVARLSTGETGRATGPAALTAHYRRLFKRRDLYLADASDHVVADLLMCAGNAAGHPKHVAYVLPDDLGHRATGGPATTLVLGNVVERCHAMISVPLYLRAFGRPPHVHGGAPHWLHTWLRAYGLGAFWSVPGRGGRALDGRPGTDPGPAGAGRRAGVLDEALADTFGFLAGYAPMGGRLVAGGGEEVFVAETLRHARRDNHRFARSAAATLTLHHLIEAGAVVPCRAGTFRLDANRVRTAMTQLGRRLIRAVLDGDRLEAQRLLASSGRNAGLPAPVERLFANCVDIPESLEYVP